MIFLLIKLSNNYMALVETLRCIPLILSNPVNKLSQAWAELMARIERDRLQELAGIRSNVFELFTTLDEAQLPNLALSVLKATQEHPYLDTIMGKALEVDVEVKAELGSGILLKWVVSEVVEQIDHPSTLRLILAEPLAETRNVWETRLGNPDKSIDLTLLAVQRLGQIQISLEQVNRVVLPS